MAEEATPPELTSADREAIAEILAAGTVLPCGGRTWSGPFNGTTPIYRLISGTRDAISARRLVKALTDEDSTGELRWANGRLYAEHWGCIDHPTSNRAKAAKEPDPPEPAPVPYPRVWDPGHPVARSSGAVYDHRRVLYDRLGPGAHRCYWCLGPVDWDAPRGDPAELTVDHLNADPADNHPSNLVASCRPCNTQRRGPADLSVLPSVNVADVAAPEPAQQPDAGATSEHVPDTTATPTGMSLRRKVGRFGVSEAFGALDAALDRLRGNRRLRVTVVLLGLFLVGLFGTALVVSSPAGFLPGVTTDRRDGPPVEPATTVPVPPPGAVATPAPVPPPTARQASTTTAWTLPEPCTPSHCPSLDD